MAPIWSLGLRYITSRESFPDHVRSGHALPLIASPVDPEAYAWLKRLSHHDHIVPGKVQRSGTVENYEAQQGTDSELAKAIFRKQHEASSLELFFDLFFVANLAVFTTNSSHVTAAAVGNYIGFFSILWSTWFHNAIYDVRFYTDCILSRAFKILCFLVMTSFTGLGAVFKAVDEGNDSSRAFNGMALVMMSFRFMLVTQYSIVFYFVHGFHRTFLPLILTILTYLVSAFAFLTIYLLDQRASPISQQGAQHMFRWYIILGVEIAIINVISSRWRVLSFRHTHLVERVGLLTLIVIGEGIIGMTKSVAYDLLGRNASIWYEAGLITAAVILIYFIYVHYFNQIDHDHSETRWGTIRQQIWVLSHYFLHIAILLTVEGQASLLTWNSCRRGINWFASIFPSTSDPGAGFASNADLVTAVNSSLTRTKSMFYYYNMTDYYDLTRDLSLLANNTLRFKSPAWKSNAATIMNNMKSNTDYYIFVNFQAKGPTEIATTSDPARKVFLYNQGYKVVFEYFYIGAGCLLLVLAAMAWFGKTKKRRDEYWSIAYRVLAGLCLPFVSLIAFLEKSGDMSGFRYTGLQWLIPIVVFCYLAVLMADNLIKVLFSFAGHRTSVRHHCDAGVEKPPRQLKLVRLQEDTSYDRRDTSRDSQATLTDDEGHQWRRSRGYSHLDQRDSVDGNDVGFDGRTMLKHKAFSFERQPLTSGEA